MSFYICGCYKWRVRGKSLGLRGHLKVRELRNLKLKGFVVVIRLVIYSSLEGTVFFLAQHEVYVLSNTYPVNSLWQLSNCATLAFAVVIQMLTLCCLVCWCPLTCQRKIV